MRIWSFCAGILVAGGLAACSGGGGGSSVAANLIPQFTSSASVSIAENTGGIVYTASASDADGDPITLSIASGGDAAAFTFNAATGALTFVGAPDFERPGDADGNNDYEVTLQARDPSGATATLNLTITVTDITQGVQIRRVATGFSQPLFVTALPDGSGRVLVVEKGGRIRLLDPVSGTIDSVDFLDVSGSISINGERGLLGLALAPDFATSGEIVVNVTNASGDTEIRRFTTFSGSLVQVDPATGDVVLTIGQLGDNHNAGWIGFDGNGLLVIPTGDGGGSGDPSNVAQDPQSLLGKVLRIDLSSDDFPSDPDRDYAIPTGNTFASAAAGLPEIYAIGLRNPFQSSFDPISGDLLIGDVGQGAIEEIDRLPMDDSSFNFGWSVREGTAAFKGADRATFTAPVAEYGHGSGDRQGNSVTGGLVYQGPVEALQDHYIFGDFISGNVWAVPVADLVNGQTVPSSQFQVLTSDFAPDAGSLSNISGFGTDASGNLYILSLGGEVFRMGAET